jgi:hypothetical protein
MIAEMPVMETPAWLAEIGGATPPHACPFPLADFLTDSLYYPACGLNGTPVKYLAGNILSFVYADYGVSRAAFLDNLCGTGAACGFKGYRPVLQREILRSEVVPDGWRPALQPQDVDAVRRLAEVERDCQPYGHWSIWQRTASADPAAGPELFSFFFLSGEISAIYQGLYTRLAIAPKVLAIIQPGTMGGEWENSCSDQSFFKQVVRSHTAGRSICYMAAQGGGVATPITIRIPNPAGGNTAAHGSASCRNGMPGCGRGGGAEVV